MKKNKMGLIALMMGAGVASTFADTAAMQTAAEGAITTAETAVVAILTAGIVITVAFWVYRKIKASLKAN